MNNPGQSGTGNSSLHNACVEQRSFKDLNIIGQKITSTGGKVIQDYRLNAALNQGCHHMTTDKTSTASD
jgi:hypothetical protein